MVLRVCLMVLLVIGAVGASAIARPLAGTPLSHIAGSSRKIKMYFNGFYLQLLPNGTVSATFDDHCPYTVLQRSSVTMGQVKIQGIATCMYLCMDSCGLLYASFVPAVHGERKEYTEECVFNENIEAHHYNSYSSTKYSNRRRTLYLGVNKKGVPRRVQIRGGNLGKLSMYTRVLTQPVSGEEALGAGGRCGAVREALPARTGRCRPPRLRWRKRKRCREDEDCGKGGPPEGRRPVPPRRRKPPPAHRLRHRKHRTAGDLELDQTTEDEFLLFDDDPADPFLDLNESE